MRKPSDAAVLRAMQVYAEEAGWPYGARVADYFPFGSDAWPLERRQEAQRELAAADSRAERQSLDLMRRAIEAALATDGEDHGTR